MLGPQRVQVVIETQSDIGGYVFCRTVMIVIRKSRNTHDVIYLNKIIITRLMCNIGDVKANCCFIGFCC